MHWLVGGLYLLRKSNGNRFDGNAKEGKETLNSGLYDD